VKLQRGAFATVVFIAAVLTQLAITLSWTKWRCELDVR
jgi:hypothetical protein